MSEANRQTIEAVYAAFGGGDVPFIQQRVTEGTRWDFSSTGSDIPWHRPVANRQEVAQFFEAFGGNVKIEAFEPHTFVTAGRDVVVKVHLAYTVVRSGKRVDEEQVHWWSFDDAGRIAALRHYEDTATVRDAWAR